VVFKDGASDGASLDQFISGVGAQTLMAADLINVTAADRIYVNDQFRNAANLNNFYISGSDVFSYGLGTPNNAAGTGAPLTWQFQEPNALSGDISPFLQVQYAASTNPANFVPSDGGISDLAAVNTFLGLTPTPTHYNSLIIGG
jgi:hypothetical protein